MHIIVQALRVISIYRGYDSSKFSLFPFGGAGGLHMCAIAEQLGMDMILVLLNAGILSAQGMFYASVGKIASKSLCQLWSEINQAIASDLFKHLQEQGLNNYRHLRYLLAVLAIGSIYDIADNRLLSAYNGRIEDIETRFQRVHEDRYGF